MTLHYFGHQNGGTCTARVGDLDALYQDILEDGIDNVKIFAIGKEEYSNDNINWTNGNSIPVMVDPIPHSTWSSWDAEQRDSFFLDQNGNYVEDFNITNFDYNNIYNTIRDKM